MIIGIKARLEIHNILYEIKKNNKNMDDLSISRLLDKYNQKDRSFIYNVCLNSMRYKFHTEKIISTYSKKKSNINQKLLLISAITQIVFLNYKDYAVINCSVEVSKKLNLYSGFINAFLKNISRDKERLKKIKISFNEFPYWFRKQTKNLKQKDMIDFSNNFYKQPHLHLVFKTEKDCQAFNKGFVKTSKCSGFLDHKGSIEDIPYFKDGKWWIQDFSSFFPLSNIVNFKSKSKFIDFCAAPGGKSFQILKHNKSIVLNDKNSSRINKLKENLKRLNFKAKINNYDVLNYNLQEKFDFVILDAPCSSIGTVRKNPEIFFKDNHPDVNKLSELQSKLLNKAGYHLKDGGYIIYMVCSFLENETRKVVNNFLKKNKNFLLSSFEVDGENSYYNYFVNNRYIEILPSSLFERNIDGYFAALIKKV